MEHGELRTMIGPCRMCGQVVTFQWGSDACTEEDKCREATLACSCEGSQSLRARQEKIAAAEERIRSVFDEEEDDFILQKLLLSMVGYVADGRVVKIAMTSGTGVKAAFSISSKGTIKVKRTVTEEREESI